MTTNITALVQRLKVAAKNGCCHTLFPDDCLALVEALEKEQAERDELQQGFIANQEEAHEAIKYATELKEQLARACAGREEAFREVDKMQRSLDHTHRRRAIWRERAHAAGMEIATLRQRIAELESRTVKLPGELSGEVLLDNDSDVVYSDDTGVLEYTNINGCFVKITAPPDKVIRFRCSNEGTYIRLVDRVKTREHAGIIIDINKNHNEFTC